MVKCCIDFYACAVCNVRFEINDKGIMLHLRYHNVKICFCIKITTRRIGEKLSVAQIRSPVSSVIQVIFLRNLLLFHFLFAHKNFIREKMSIILLRRVPVEHPFSDHIYVFFTQFIGLYLKCTSKRPLVNRPANVT